MQHQAALLFFSSLFFFLFQLFWRRFRHFSAFFLIVAKLEIPPSKKKKKGADGAVFVAQVGERVGPNREGRGVCDGGEQAGVDVQEEHVPSQSCVGPMTLIMSERQLSFNEKLPSRVQHY